MNGAVYQICCITAAAREALKKGTGLEYVPDKYLNEIKFCFLPGKVRKGKTVKTAAAWFERCKGNGLEDVKFICPVDVKDRGMLGFSNTSQSSILCFFKNRKVTFFTPYWEFNSFQKLWDVVYTEHEWKDPPKGRPVFQNNTEAFYI